jgi:hypothetical protein
MNDQSKTLVAFGMLLGKKLKFYLFKIIFLCFWIVLKC